MTPTSVPTLDRREFLTASGLVLAAPLAGPLLRRPPEDLDTGRGVPIEEFIRKKMKEGRIPGLAAGLVDGNKLVRSYAAGWANIEEGRRMRKDTIFMMASISKTVTGTGVMRAVEQGAVDLDEDIDTYLPFPVRTPNHPDDPITTRMLLTHTAALRDNWKNFIYTRGDAKMPLSGFLRRWFVPGRDLYDADKNFFPWHPGTKYTYSNIGVTLAAYVAECATGVDFEQWCRRRIFRPLEMKRTSWHLKGLPRDEVAMPYEYTRKGFKPYGQYGYPDYPDGALRTTVGNLSRHVRMITGGGAFHGTRLLQSDTVAEMIQPQFGLKDQGLIWYWVKRDGVRYIGHNGGDSGVATSLLFREDGVGAMVFTNGDWHGWPVQQIAWRLFDEIDG